MEHRIDASSKDLRTASLEIKKAIGNAVERIVVENASHIHGLAAGLNEGNILIDGDVGDYAAALNDGATITIDGDAGKFLADNMTRGTVVVNGDSGYGAAEYCYGGVVVIRGDTGGFLGALNKGGTILVVGNAGNDVGTYMVGGDIVIVGDAGKDVGNWHIRGSIFVGGNWKTLGHNCKETSMEKQDVRKLKGYFTRFNVAADPGEFRKLVPISAKPFYK